MFSSNVNPKRVVKQLDSEDWECHKCSRSVRHYLSKCLKCGSRRDQGDSYRKGGKSNKIDRTEDT